MSVAAPSYEILDHCLILDNESRSYVMKVRDMPQEDKPRERMLSQGAAALKVAELLAIILNTGTVKEGVLSMSHRVLSEYGERSLAAQHDPKKLSEDVGIPLGKAMQIVACAELGRRFFKKDHYGAIALRTARDVFDYTKDMRELPKEHLRGIYLNAHHRIIHDEIISIGTVNANVIHPREVFRPALQYAAVALVLVHNHPSGEILPSIADIEVTQQIVSAGKILGIDLLDHVIVTKDRFASIAVDYQGTSLST